MDNAFYIFLAVAYLVFYIFRAANKRNQQKQGQRPVDTSQTGQAPAPVQPRNSKNVFDILREEIEGRQPSPPPTPQASPEPMDYDPFKENRDANDALMARRKAEKMREEAERQHYSEERIVQEFIRTHSQGKAISHHTHDYFDPLTEKLKSPRQVDRAKKHPITRLLRGRKNIRNALILREVLDRKH
jgi:hypothetical protein